MKIYSKQELIELITKKFDLPNPAVQDLSNTSSVLHFGNVLRVQISERCLGAISGVWVIVSYNDVEDYIDDFIRSVNAELGE